MDASRWRVVVTPRSLDVSSPELAVPLAASGCEIIRAPGPHDSKSLAALWSDADGAILGLDEADAAAIEAARQLRTISRYGVGYDNVDVAAATRAGVVVTITPDALQNAVADFTMALVLVLVRRLDAYLVAQPGSDTNRQAQELAGLTLGVVGLGRIGRGVARRALGFGMTVAYADPSTDAAAAGHALGARSLEFDDLLQTADVVSLHTPLTTSTEHLIRRRELALMKHGAFLVNTARGGLLDERALADALREGRLAGAALDVRAVESGRQEDPLDGVPNLVLTPHIASRTTQSSRRMGRDAVNNLLAVKGGRIPETAVNGPAIAQSREERSGRVDGDRASGDAASWQ